MGASSRKGLLQLARLFVEATNFKAFLKLPDHSKPFILRTDASNCGLDAALMQQHDEKPYPVAYASKKLASAETNYSTLEKECLGIVWDITKFRLYLAGKPFM